MAASRAAASATYVAKKHTLAEPSRQSLPAAFDASGKLEARLIRPSLQEEAVSAYSVFVGASITKPFTMDIEVAVAVAALVSSIASLGFRLVACTSRVHIEEATVALEAVAVAAIISALVVECAEPHCFLEVVAQRLAEWEEGFMACC